MIAVLCFGLTIMLTNRDGTSIMLPSGGMVLGQPHDTDAYRETAAALGYGDDTAALNREHEAAHCALAHLIGLPQSPVMAHVAGETPDDPVRHALEEAAVLALQRYARAYGVDLIEAWRTRP